MSLPTKQIEENIISVLLRLDSEAKAPNITAEEFGRRGIAIRRILEKAESDFGQQFMAKIFIDASKKQLHI